MGLEGHSHVLVLPVRVLSPFFCREAIALVNKALLIFSIFHLFEAFLCLWWSLRGIGQLAFGAIVHAIRCHIIGLPLGVVLTFEVRMRIKGLWLGMLACVYIARLDWKLAGEETSRSAAPVKSLSLTPSPHCSLRTDLPIMGREGTDGVILPDVIRPESQTLQLMVLEENTQSAVSTTGDVLTLRQLIFYRGMALALAVVVLLAGIFIRVFNDRG
uniref:Uncharacterized protein n=1 Tax=Prolemur simus TaxID=1328070 RepID=A0A8C9AU46_PROSS